MSSSDKTEDCVVGIEDSSGNVIPFDIQSAEPGAFVMPGAGDIETYEPGSMARASWIYFKGYPREHGPDHPFEKPFDELAIYNIDLVRDDDTSTVLREIMPPAPTALFWLHSAPFSKPGNFSVDMYSPLNESCKYYYFKTLSFFWVIPEDIKEDSVFRLKLTTNEPPTTHLSGKLRFSHAEAAAPSSATEPAPTEPTPVEPAPVEPAPVEPAPVEPTPIEPTPVELASVKAAPMEDFKPIGVSRVNVAGATLAVLLAIPLACFVALRLRRKRKQIILGKDDSAFLLGPS